MKPLVAPEDVEEPALIKGNGHAITEEVFGKTEADPVHQ